jgi:hypothetical protein
MSVFTRIAWISLLCPPTLFGQGSPAETGDRGSLDLMVGNSGLSFGNGQNMNGLRFAWRDGDFVMVNGINVSFWLPYDRPSGEVNGISFGLVASGGERFRGLSLGLGGVVAKESMQGVNIGGLGVVSQGALTGVTMSGLGVVSQGMLTGVNIGGLGVVSQGALTGINLAGLGLVGQAQSAGINAAGLGVVSQGALAGFTFAGLGIVSQGSNHGVSVAGLGIVSQGEMTGLHVAGVGCIAQESLTGVSVTMGMASSERTITGMTFAGYKVKAPEIVGVNVSILWSESSSLTGFTFAGYNRTYGLQQGLVIGIFNHTEDLLGIQIGLLNYVENNPPWARLLPIFNANF